jgi:hypothetical protein
LGNFLFERRLTAHLLVLRHGFLRRLLPRLRWLFRVFLRVVGILRLSVDLWLRLLWRWHLSLRSR